MAMPMAMPVGVIAKTRSYKVSDYAIGGAYRVYLSQTQGLSPGLTLHHLPSGYSAAIREITDEGVVALARPIPDNGRDDGDELHTVDLLTEHDEMLQGTTDVWRTGAQLFGEEAFAKLLSHSGLGTDKCLKTALQETF